MSTPNINCILQAVVAATNNLLSPQPQIVNFDFGNPTLGAKLLEFIPYFMAFTTPGTAVALPIVPSFVLMVQNLSATANIQVAVTPGGSGQAVFPIGPQGLFIYMDPTETTAGITAATIIGVGGSVPTMLLVGG
jgi:hypothetical protein